VIAESARQATRRAATIATREATPTGPRFLFGTISNLDSAASSSHFDDAMIRHRSRRMTVAQLKERMDARFNAVDRRFNAVDKRFDALDKKLDAHLASITVLLKHHDRVVDEHDERLKELETRRRTTRDI
jgi:hypothetical protein